MQPVNELALQPGTAMHGGFFAGIVQVDGLRYGVVVAPKSARIVKGPWGEFGKKIEATHVSDGMANTLAMAEAGSQIATLVRSMDVNDFKDWYIPARDEQELIYRNLKPTTEKNYCSFRDGDNPTSLPFGTPYTQNNPAQTIAAAFQEGGPEAIATAWHWTSTQSSARTAYVQYFSGGNQYYSNKVNEFSVLPVRRFLIN